MDEAVGNARGGGDAGKTGDSRGMAARMRAAFLVPVLLALLSASCAREMEVSLERLGDAYAATSVNTCAFRGSSIASDRRMRVAAYYDGESRVTLALQERGSGRWEVVHTPLSGRTQDAHNVISIALDGDGYIHVCLDQHGSPMRYCRSLEPYKAVFPEPSGMLGRGEDDVTYPEFHRLSNGDLLFFYRDGSSGRGNLVLNRYGVAEGRWSRVQDVLVDGQGERSAYPQVHVDARDGVHLSWVWRESRFVESNHDMCYAYSPDGGLSWQRTDGSRYDMPITAANAEYAWRIPQGSELINQTSMTADARGRPCIATYWRDAGSDVPQFRLVWFDGAAWKCRQVGARTQAFSLDGGGTKAIPISRPAIALAARGPVMLFRDAARGSVVSAFVAKDLEGEWTVRDLTDFSVDMWEPTIDRDALRREGRLSVFVQRSAQLDGAGAADVPPRPAFVLDCR